MSTSQGAGSGGIDFAALLTSISAQPDPLDYLVKYLEGQRIPPQGSFFRIHAFAALGMHGCIVACILLTTWVRSRRDQLWFTRRQQGRLRLNATVIAILFVAIYSSMAIAYTALLLEQQRVKRYLAGSAAFQMSCFSAISICVSVIAFTYHQSLPVGFESSFFRTLFHKRHAAVDGRFFSFAFLCIWLVISVAGLMAFPIIHDYWRRQADSNLESIVNFLKREDVRERGLPALMNIADQLQRLPYQVQQAHLALKRQLLVFMGHCGLYLLVIIPVAWKLLHLLNKQMDALRRSAEDYFRVGTRLDKPKKQSEGTPAALGLIKSSSASKTQAQLTQAPSKSMVASPKVAIVVCSNCSHEQPVDLGSHQVGTFRPARKQETNVQRYSLHPDFPLQKLKRLKRVRLELAGFSGIIIFGLANFLAWTCVAYGSASRWTSSEITANLFVISLWSYAVPAGISSIFYAYTTAQLATPGSGATSTAASQRSGPTKSSQSATCPWWRRLLFCKPRPYYRQWDEEPRQYGGGFQILDNKRSRPTFPRVASFATFGTPFTPATEMEVIAAGKEYDLPPVQSSIETLQWVEEQKRELAQNKAPRLPPPSVVSRISMRSLRSMSRRNMPVSMTQSWLDTEDD